MNFDHDRNKAATTSAESRAPACAGERAMCATPRPIINDDTITVRLPAHLAAAIEVSAVTAGKKSQWLREAATSFIPTGAGA